MNTPALTQSQSDAIWSIVLRDAETNPRLRSVLEQKIQASCDRTWTRIQSFLDAEPGMATSNPGNAGAGSRTPEPCLTAQPPLPGGRVPAGGEVGR